MIQEKLEEENREEGMKRKKMKDNVHCSLYKCYDFLSRF